MKLPRKKYNAFTLKSESLLRELRTPVRVSSHRLIEKQTYGQAYEEYDAIWDTGAQSSVCSKKVISSLNLEGKEIDKVPVRGVNSQTNCYVYLISQLILPNNVIVVDIPVIVGDIGGSDILIGMDIITRGDFAITHHDNKTIFSFCIPPHYNKIDFVERSNAIMRRRGNNI